MIIKILRYQRQVDREYIFSDTSTEFETRISFADIDSSEFEDLEFGRDYRAICDDQGFWRFERID